MFVLNLALVDLLYCVICMPSYVFAFLRTYWPFGQTYCQIVMALILVLAHANWFSLGLIAITRCLGLTRKGFWEDFCSYRNITLAIYVAVWIWVLLINIPLYIEKSLTFGFSCQMGKCDIIPTGMDSTLPETVNAIFPHFISFAVPLLIVLVNYLVIWYYVKSASRYLKSKG